MNTWTHQNQELTEPPENTIGFVYLITNLVSGRKYIGKKNFYSTRATQKTVVLKTTGEKKKKKVRKTTESDWKTYHGSSEELKADVTSLGTENFKREILCFCKSKGELSYYEIRYQLLEDVLLHPEIWYNSWVSCKIHRRHMLTSK
jgi:hypothetical protein